MPKFKVWITSDEPLKTKKALDKAQMPTIGPTFTKFVQAEGSLHIGLDMTAVLEAESSDDAARRIREASGHPEVSVHESVPWD